MVAFVSGNGFKEPSTTTFITFSVTSVPLGSLVWFLAKHEGSSTSITVSDGVGNLAMDTLGLIVNAAGNDLNGGMFFTTASATSGTVNYTMTIGAGRAFVQAACGVFSYTGTITRNAGSQQATSSAGGDLGASSGPFSPSGSDMLWLGGWGNYFTGTPTSRGIAGVVTASTFGNADGTQAWYVASTAGFTNGEAYADLTQLDFALIFGVAFSATTAAAGASVQPQMSGDLSGLGAPGRFFQDRLQRVIDFYRAVPA